MDKVELKLIGITYNQIESGVYALLLESEEMKRRLAIVIGYPEAQSIECHLQAIKTPRPLSHDVMASMIRLMYAHLDSIFIRKLPTGPYAAFINITDEIGRNVVVDARSSDAIALAIRMNAPIFTSRELMEQEGFSPEERKANNPIARPAHNIKDIQSGFSTDNLEKMSDEMLKKHFEECVKNEKYEDAALTKKELERRGILPDLNID